MTADADDVAQGVGWAVGQVLYRLFEHLDACRYTELAGLFTPDGVWHRQGLRCQGPAQLIEVLARRPRRQRVCHVLTNVVVEAGAQADRVRARFVNTAWQSPTDPDAPEPAWISAPLGVWRGDAQLHRLQGRWRIAELQQRQLFGFGPAP